MRSYLVGIILLGVLFSSVEATPRHKRYTSSIYDLSLPAVPNGEVSFINGMNHKPDRAVSCAKMLSEITGGYNVYVVYNPTGGFLHDLAKCFVELYNYKATPPIRKLHEKWDAFFDAYPKDRKLLQFCHSEGSIQVRNALFRYPPALRKRIIVIAIAPAAYIPDFICSDAIHYASRRDIVPNLDKRGKKWCANKTVILTPHPRASIFDHHFLSPTYQPAINHHLKQYLIEECNIQ